MRRLLMLVASLFLLSGTSYGFWWSKPDELPKEKNLLDRLMNPDRSSKSAYEGKAFNTSGSFSDRKFSTMDYSGNKMFQSKSFETKSFEDSKRNWFGKMLFPGKKLPENLQGANRDAVKKFATKDVSVKEFADASKKDPYAGKEAFETKQINLKGKTQGAIDNDPHLQDAVKKGLSIDDVKRLLNKPGSPSK
jgi:hypothetical protein